MTAKAMEEWAREVEAKAAQIERDRKDAERYRWLRERVYKDEGRLHCQGPNVDGYAFGHMGDALDAAIDAELGREPQEGEQSK